ncbi:MAG: hypothetical protein ACI97A_001879 [Planctomycetota bacterium]|jgi:hypothetical protein
MIRESLAQKVSSRLYFRRDYWRPGGATLTPHGKVNAMENAPIQGRITT